MTQREHADQCAVITWAGMMQEQRPELKNLYAIPNAAKRTPAGASYYKAEGMRAGVPDLCLAWPSGKFHGLFIEMKHGDNKPTENQADWLKRLSEAGYACAVCYGVDEAINVIKRYLGMEVG